ncbi:MAG: hypothetical protein ACI861_000972, partial [Paracoccaceae bacterium]
MATLHACVGLAVKSPVFRRLQDAQQTFSLLPLTSSSEDDQL